MVVDFLEIVSTGCKHGIDPVAVQAFEKVSAHAVMLLGMRKDRFDGGTAFEEFVLFSVFGGFNDDFRFTLIVVTSVSFVAKEIVNRFIDHGF